MRLKQAAEAFLNEKCIAVAGVSRTKKDAANVIYDKLKQSGYRVFAINPNADSIDGDVCYPDLKSAPEKIGGVVIVTKPAITEQLVKQCHEAGISKVWMHRSIGNSVSQAAVKFCEDNHIQVIAGGCPMMFCRPVDFGHKCMHFFMNVFGRLPREVSGPESQV